MATVNYTFVELGDKNSTVTWSGMTSADQGEVFDITRYEIKTVHVFGALGLYLLGSNDSSLSFAPSDIIALSRYSTSGSGVAAISAGPGLDVRWVAPFPDGTGNTSRTMILFLTEK